MKDSIPPLIDAYLTSIDNSLRALPAVQRSAIRAELLAHISDAAADQHLRLDDPAAQALLLEQLGPPGQLARSFRSVHGRHYAWFGAAGMVGALLLPLTWLYLAYVMYWSGGAATGLRVGWLGTQVPLGATLILLVVFQLGLYGRYGVQLHPAGRLGLITSMLGTVLFLSAIVARYEPSAIMLSSMTLQALGLACFGIDATRQHVVPGWRAAPALFGLSPLLLMVLFAAQIQLVAIQMALSFVFPSAWFVLAYLLWRDRAPAPLAPSAS